MNKTNKQPEKTETIAAPATAVGGSSVALIRVSGPNAIAITDRIFSGRSLSTLAGFSSAHGWITDKKGTTIDEVIVHVYKSPRSYTGENQVEIGCHGTPIAVEKILLRLIEAGARLANPGEFTERAFYNGKLDLTQAEAIADIVAAESDLSFRNASLQLKGILRKHIETLIADIKKTAGLLELELDFSEEDLSLADSGEIRRSIDDVIKKLASLQQSFGSARVLKEGVKLAIVGRPNTGKSSLLNALLKRERAIVSHVPGTTRDTIEENVHFGRLLVRIIDTAGIRKTADQVEQMGVDRSRGAIKTADFVLFVFDASADLEEADFAVIETDIPTAIAKNAMIVLNKSDLAPVRKTKKTLSALGLPVVAVSAKDGLNISDLVFHVEHLVLENINYRGEDIYVTNIRQQQAITQATLHLNDAKTAITNNFGKELIADDLRRAIDKLDIIIGKVTSTDVLNAVFDQFCIGK